MGKGLENFYFTFGTSPTFPYREGYLIVKAHNREEAVDRYRRSYEDKHDNTINCSFIYDEEIWKKDNIQQYYKEPFEVMSIYD